MKIKIEKEQKTKERLTEDKFDVIHNIYTPDTPIAKEGLGRTAVLATLSEADKDFVRETLENARIMERIIIRMIDKIKRRKAFKDSITEEEEEYIRKRAKEIKEMYMETVYTLTTLNINKRGELIKYLLKNQEEEDRNITEEEAESLQDKLLRKIKGK